MKALEVLEVAIEKGILVVPFDLQSDCRSSEVLDVIDFVRNRFLLFTVDNPLNLEPMLLPSTLLSKRFPKSLS
jgi:hypothetical protein